MGIYGNWLRLPAADLTRAINDLDWAYEQARAAVESKDDRWLSTDKTWHALDFLLNRYGLGVPIVFGEARLIDANESGDVSLSDADWGTGPAGYLKPESVATAAGKLAALTGAALIQDVDAAELEAAEIYPHVWADSADELEWAVHYLADVRRFFIDAAAAGDAIICWLD